MITRDVWDKQAFGRSFRKHRGMFMHKELARQSVVIKCSLEASIMTGNYEYYYSAGLLSKLTGQDIPRDIRPEQLHNQVQEMLKVFEPADGREKHLAGMLRYYHPDERYDEEMAGLLEMGISESRLWQRIT